MVEMFLIEVDWSYFMRYINKLAASVPELIKNRLNYDKCS